MKFTKLVKATDGWEDNQTIQKIQEKLAIFDKLNYEIKHQVKGAFTGATTPIELMHFIKRESRELAEIANDLQYEVEE